MDHGSLPQGIVGLDAPEDPARPQVPNMQNGACLINYGKGVEYDIECHAGIFIQQAPHKMDHGTRKILSVSFNLSSPVGADLE